MTPMNRWSPHFSRLVEAELANGASPPWTVPAVAPAIRVPSQIWATTAAGSLRAIQKAQLVGSTRRTIGPARMRGSGGMGVLLNVWDYSTADE